MKTKNSLERVFMIALNMIKERDPPPAPPCEGGE
jgi:hypothetical protein